MFLTTALNVEVARDMRHLLKSQQIVKDHPHIYDVITIVTTVIFLTYATAPFLLLSWEDSITVLRTFYFSGHVIVIALFLTFLAIKKTNPMLLRSKRED